MIATIQIDDHAFRVDLSKPIDISLPLIGSEKNPVAWYLDAPKIEPVVIDGWVAKVSEGASVNFNNVYFNPHAHGTHTECLGHISEAFNSVNQHLQNFFFETEVISVEPIAQDDDRVITATVLESLLGDRTPKALVIRTLPNSEEKKTRKYSHTNWPYLEAAAAMLLREKGVEHILIDLPSVDKEKDDGRLEAHKAFWNCPEAPRYMATITELIFVPDAVSDGPYLLNLMVAPFENDATPSKPVLYKLLQ